jgi:hypothetical protein
MVLDGKRPRLRIACRSLPEPALRASRTVQSIFFTGMVLPGSPMIGMIGFAPAEAGAFSVVPSTRLGGNVGHPARRRRHDAVPAYHGRRCAALARRRPFGARRRRSVRYVDRNGRGRNVAHIARTGIGSSPRRCGAGAPSASTLRKRGRVAGFPPRRRSGRRSGTSEVLPRYSPSGGARRSIAERPTNSGRKCLFSLIARRARVRCRYWIGPTRVMTAAAPMRYREAAARSVAARRVW